MGCIHGSCGKMPALCFFVTPYFLSSGSQFRHGEAVMSSSSNGTAWLLYLEQPFTSLAGKHRLQSNPAMNQDDIRAFMYHKCKGGQLKVNKNKQLLVVLFIHLGCCCRDVSLLSHTEELGGKEKKQEKQQQCLFSRSHDPFTQNNQAYHRVGANLHLPADETLLLATARDLNINSILFGSAVISARLVSLVKTQRQSVGVSQWREQHPYMNLLITEFVDYIEELGHDF